jgi:hypothetical protein
VGNEVLTLVWAEETGWNRRVEKKKANSKFCANIKYEVLFVFMREMRNPHRIVAKNWTDHFCKLDHRWEDDITGILKNLDDWGHVDLAQGRVQWRVLVKAVMVWSVSRIDALADSCWDGSLLVSFECWHWDVWKSYSCNVVGFLFHVRYRIDRTVRCLFYVNCWNRMGKGPYERR